MTLKRSVQSDTVKSVGAEIGHRQVLSVVSSEHRDRVGDVIKQDGIDYSDFMRLGGTVLWQHDSNHPVARTVQMGIVNGNLTALSQFPPEGTSEKSDECYRLIREGVVNSTSIGFIPEEWEFLDKNRSGSGVLFRKVQLLEFSYVSVPANPAAAIIAKSYPGIYRQRRAAPAPSTRDYCGTLAQRQAQLHWDHPEIEQAAAEAERDVALLAANPNTREGRSSILRAHRQFSRRMGWWPH